MAKKPNSNWGSWSGEGNDTDSGPGRKKTVPVIIAERYDEGYSAGMSGEPEDSCPYCVGTGSPRYSWISGHLQARFDKKEVI